MIRDFFFILFFMSIFSVAFASDMSFEQAKRTAFAQPSKVVNEYTPKFNATNNATHADQTRGCYKLGASMVRQVFVLDQRGLVTNVISSDESPKAACFKKIYAGTVLPSPPSDPYYLYIEFE